MEKGIFRRQELIYDPLRDGAIEVEGDLSVISALKQQAEKVAAGEEDPNIRAMLFLLPGGNSGVNGGGQVTAMHEAGLTNGFKVVIGSSVGAHTAAWFLAGDPRLGNTILSEECTTKDFIRLKRIPDGYGIDVGFISQLYRGEVGNKPLSVERIKEAKPDFRIAATEYATGRGVLLDGKSEPIIDKLEASSAIPGLYRIPIYIDGVRYCDAAAGAFFPLKEVVDTYDPTHILVLPNFSKQSLNRPFVGKADMVLAQTLPQPLRRAWLGRGESFKQSLELESDLKKKGVSVLTIFPDDAIKQLTTDSKAIAASGARAEAHMKHLIETAR